MAKVFSLFCCRLLFCHIYVSTNDYFLMKTTSCPNVKKINKWTFLLFHIVQRQEKKKTSSPDCIYVRLNVWCKTRFSKNDCVCLSKTTTSTNSIYEQKRNKLLKQRKTHLFHKLNFRLRVKFLLLFYSLLYNFIAHTHLHKHSYTH